MGIWYNLEKFFLVEKCQYWIGDGMVKSPYHPYDFPKFDEINSNSIQFHINCKWIINATEDHYIKLTLHNHWV